MQSLAKSQPLPSNSLVPPMVLGYPCLPAQEIRDYLHSNRLVRAIAPGLRLRNSMTTDNT